jgi:hypothetical protein
MRIVPRKLVLVGDTVGQRACVMLTVFRVSVWIGVAVSRRARVAEVGHRVLALVVSGGNLVASSVVVVGCIIGAVDHARIGGAMAVAPTSKTTATIARTVATTITDTTVTITAATATIVIFSSSSSSSSTTTTTTDTTTTIITTSSSITNVATSITTTTFIINTTITAAAAAAAVVDLVDVGAAAVEVGCSGESARLVEVEHRRDNVVVVWGEHTLAPRESFLVHVESVFMATQRRVRHPEVVHRRRNVGVVGRQQPLPHRQGTLFKNKRVVVPPES